MAVNNPRFGNTGSGRQEREGNNPSMGTHGGGTHGGGKPEESGGVMGAVMEGAENIASSVASYAGQAWDATRSGAQSAGTAVAHGAEVAWDSTTDFMRRYPIVTLAAGVSIGFMLCMALQSRRA